MSSHVMAEVSVRPLTVTQKSLRLQHRVPNPKAHSPSSTGANAARSVFLKGAFNNGNDKRPFFANGPQRSRHGLNPEKDRRGMQSLAFFRVSSGMPGCRRRFSLAADTCKRISRVGKETAPFPLITPDGRVSRIRRSQIPLPRACTRG